MSTETPTPPTGTKAAGKRLWLSILDSYELDEHEMAVLVEAVRTVDQLDALDVMVRREGVVVDTPQGPRAHPALVEARQQRIVLARLLTGLRLPQGEAGQEQASARPQRRGGSRGTYALKAARP